MNQSLRNHVFSSSSSFLEDKQLELRLAPPGNQHDDSSSSSYCINNNNNNNNKINNNGVCKNSCSRTEDGSLLSLGLKKNGSCCSNSSMANHHNHNTSQKRSAQTPLVGWPPVRSFRKNLSTQPSCSKPVSQSENEVLTTTTTTNAAGKKVVENCKKAPFVKINMDGVPIGRKVDLNAYSSYESLSFAVDDLFRALLAAQRGPSKEEKAITGLLDGTGEYTLVYEDNEGDRMLVGDVPWNMFVTTVKRLRVLKSSDLSVLTLGSNNKQGKTSTPT